MTTTILVALLIYLLIVVLNVIMAKQAFKDLLEDDSINPYYAQALLCVMPIVNLITFIWFILFYVHEIFRKN